MFKGSTIRKVREQIGESQIEFAKRLGVHQSTVSVWETGQTTPRGPALKFLKILLAELEATDV